jgi:hypothetical protein
LSFFSSTLPDSYSEDKKKEKLTTAKAAVTENTLLCFYQGKGGKLPFATGHKYSFLLMKFS